MSNTIYLETYGCSANQNNSEILSGLIERAGFIVTGNEKIADIAVINTCVVKGPTEQKMLSRIKELASKFNKLIVAGCIVDVEAQNVKEIIKTTNKNCKLALLSVHQITKIQDAIKSLIEGKSIEFTEKTNETKLCLPKTNKNKIIGITQIASGCLGNCAYCYVKFVKGNLFSFPKEKIIKNIESDLASGCKEIWLTSQDNASYGLDHDNQNIPELLKDIFSLKHKFFLKLGMMNPNHVLPILDELIDCYKNDKMFKFLHIPIQSGSDNVLKSMNRKYKAKDFIKIIEKFRKKIPEICISTDIICGFPGETEKDWQETIEIIKKTRPNIINNSKFCSMPKTEARKLKKLPSEVIKQRTTEMFKLHYKIALEKNKREIGKIYKVLIDEKSFQGTFTARNINYRPIIIFSKENLVGKFLEVKIEKATPTYLIGKLIKN